MEPALDWTSAGFTKPLRLVLEAVLRPEREIAVRSEGGVVQEVAYSGHVPHLIDERALPAGRRLWRSRRAAPRAATAERAASAPTSSYLLALVLVAARRRAAGADRMSGADGRRRRRPARRRASLLAPLLPGLVQHWKARLQGRRGPTPLQPYRELRRLWGKSTVDVEGTGVVYRLAPAVVGASVAAAVLLVPVARPAPELGRRPRRARAGRAARARALRASRPPRGTSRTASR